MCLLLITNMATGRIFEFMSAKLNVVVIYSSGNYAQKATVASLTV